MAIGFEGPIDARTELWGMVEYALARTYRILDADRNQREVSCKICGITLRRDTGHQVLVAGLLASSPKTYYVCETCFQPIKAANEVFPAFDPLPSWWKVLDRRPTPPGQTPAVAGMSTSEINHLIRERQRQPPKKRRSR